MSLLDTLIASAQSGALSSAAQNRGVQAGQLPGLLEQLVPVLTSGIQRNMSKPGGLESLGKALTAGNHGRYLDDASALDNAVEDGNGILGHILGSKDVSRQLASRASQQTGIDVGAIKKLLPIVAAAAMGALSKQSVGGQPAASQAGSGLESLIGGFLDADKDGSVIDDLFNLGKRFLK